VNMMIDFYTLLFTYPAGWNILVYVFVGVVLIFIEYHYLLIVDN